MAAGSIVRRGALSMHSWPPGHLHHTTCAEPFDKFPLISSICVHDPDLYSAPASIRVEDDLAAVRRPGRIVTADGSGLFRQLIGVRAIGAHDPDLAVASLMACPEHDALPVRRPIGRIRIRMVGPDTVGQSLLPRAITLHDPDLRTTTLGRGVEDSGVIRRESGKERPRRPRVGLRSICQLTGGRAVRIDYPDFGMSRDCVFGGEGDLGKIVRHARRQFISDDGYFDLRYSCIKCILEIKFPSARAIGSKGDV